MLINRLSDKLDEALKNDANKGEKRMCKDQGQGQRDRRDKDDHDSRGGDGRKRSERNISRENFLVVPAPPSSSTPRHDKSQSRCHKREGRIHSRTRGVWFITKHDPYS
nr:hypothetical protein Iba_chr03aCG4300 [Ipomoea batatas]